MRAAKFDCLVIYSICEQYHRCWVVICLKKQLSINSVSYVRVNGKLTDTKELSPEQQLRLATWLKAELLNKLFEGRARFYTSE